MLITSISSFSLEVFKIILSMGLSKWRLRCIQVICLYISLTTSFGHWDLQISHPFINFYPFTTQSRHLMTRERRLLKTFWEKEKMLVTSIFSFSQNVFHLSQNIIQILSHIYFVVFACA